MIGNIFISLNEATYNGLIPSELSGRYSRVDKDEEGNLIDILDTTFKEMGEDNKQRFGSVIEIEINSEKFYILELNASWVSGEVTALINLSNRLPFPNNTLLLADEARELINENRPIDND